MKNGFFEIALLGKPNVGKSSLFNALLGYRRAIVLDQEGTTIDVLEEAVDWNGQFILLKDTQGRYHFEKSESFLASMADAYLFVVDRSQPLTPFEKELAKNLIQSQKPVLLCLNKSDAKTKEDLSGFLELGFEEFVEVSASHKKNIENLREWSAALASKTQTPLPKFENARKSAEFSLALVGKPNSGKSTLLNQMIGRDISRTSPEPLTTRDPIHATLQVEGTRIQIVDTAGLRRPRSSKSDVEQKSIEATLYRMEKADVVLMLVNTQEGICDQDLRLLNLVIRKGKPFAVLLNFWDKTRWATKEAFLRESDFYPHLKDYPVFTVSGLTGLHVDQILRNAVRMWKKSSQRIKTSKLNSIVQDILAKNPPPAAGLQNFNIMYAAQVSISPPSFVFFMNRKAALPGSYKKFLENQLREKLRLKGQALRVYFREQSSSRREA